MTEEQVKSQYRAIHAPQNLRGQVLAACATARRQRAGQRKKFASMAACLAVVLCLSVYGRRPCRPLPAAGRQWIAAARRWLRKRWICLAARRPEQPLCLPWNPRAARK